ncbi:hypothetical protein DPEC_G00204200 [Dallia pectoralis]|uniref:Uncharacterized protein n=1 Tax=Dallia pectoralis TaxID=75939 RepID=A0ACC2G9U1_DALPE|nr:hypothetical protein DPEC_G00204200 [Dallia pectoralis]
MQRIRLGSLGGLRWILDGLISQRLYVVLSDPGDILSDALTGALWKEAELERLHSGLIQWAIQTVWAQLAQGCS